MTGTGGELRHLVDGSGEVARVVQCQDPGAVTEQRLQILGLDRASTSNGNGSGDPALSSKGRMVRGSRAGRASAERPWRNTYRSGLVRNSG